MARYVALFLTLLVALSSLTNSAEARKRHRHFSGALSRPTVNINISISSQDMNVIVDGSHYATWDVSTARAGFWTPRGSWRINRMSRVHYSKQFHNYPLPYAMFFVGGVAIHATKGEAKLGTAASHGCVRLSLTNAARLYALVQRYGMKKALVTVSY